MMQTIRTGLAQEDATERMSKKLYAVLTGDVVRSSKLTGEELDRLFEALGEAVREAGSWDASMKRTQFYRYRGDGWQLVLREPRWALRLCLFVRAFLKAADPKFATRIAVGIGGVDHLDETNLASSSGEAFVLSGQLLEKMREAAFFKVTLGAGMATAAPLVPVVFALCDTVASHWTRRQAEVMRFALHCQPPTQQEIARLVTPPISQSAVTVHLTKSGVDALSDALTSFEALLAPVVVEAPG